MIGRRPARGGVFLTTGFLVSAEAFRPERTAPYGPEGSRKAAARRNFAIATKCNDRIATRCAIRPLVNAVRVTDS